MLEIKDDSPGKSRVGAINFLQTNDTVRGQIAYQIPDGPMTFRVDGTTRATLNATGLDISAGQVTFGIVEGSKDAGANLIGTIGIESLAVGGRIPQGAIRFIFSITEGTNSS